MTSTAAERDGDVAAPLIEVVLPVRNRGPEFAEDVANLHAALAAGSGAFRLVIADAGSTDGSWLVARRLAAELPDVYAQQVPARGGTAAVRQVWEASDADVVADLRTLPYTGGDVAPGLADLLSGRIDVSVGAGYLAVRTVIAQALLSDMNGRIRRFEVELVAAATRHGLRIQRSSRWASWRQRIMSALRWPRQS